MGAAGVSAAAGAMGAAGVSAAAGAMGAAGVGGSAGVPASASTAVDLCKQVVARLCHCPTSSDEATCNRTEVVEFGCDRATSDQFPSCLADVTAASCDALFSQFAGLTLPASCDDPINTIPLSTAQMECATLAAADCTRRAQCEGVSTAPDALQPCESEDYGTANCSFAIDVGASYGQCLADLAIVACLPNNAGEDPTAIGPPSCANAIVLVQ
jgi:hypothetical protein